jgi:hypothetical protein
MAKLDQGPVHSLYLIIRLPMGFPLMLERVNCSAGVQLCVTVYGKLIDEDKWYRFACDATVGSPMVASCLR